MPSDAKNMRDRLLEQGGAAFTASLVTTVEQVRGMLASQHTAVSSADDEAGLGAFAAGRIDVARFASFLERGDPLDLVAIEQVEAAAAVLRELAENPLADVRAAVAPEATLRDTVAHTLARIGRAFGAAGCIARARARRAIPESSQRSLSSHAFAAWSPAERALAPSIWIEVPGTKLQAAALAEFLDGEVKIVLAVEGECPPAPLARLIGLPAMVVQARDEEELGGLLRFEGAGIGLVSAHGAVPFTYDPSRGETFAERLTVEHETEERKLRAIGGISIAQQRADWDWLLRVEEMAKGAVAGAAAQSAAVSSEVQEGTRTSDGAVEAGSPAAQPAEATPADRLAALLLQKSGLAAGG